MTSRFRDEPQYSNSVTMPLPVATQDTAELIRYALQGVKQIFREGYRYQKAGVILTALVPVSQVQTHLFDRHDRERSQKLMAAIDTINREWGSGTNHTLCGCGTETRMADAVYSTFTALYDTMGGISSGAMTVAVRKGVSKPHSLTDSPLVLPKGGEHNATKSPIIGEDTT